MVTRDASPIDSKVNTIRIDGMESFAVPSGFAKPSRTSKLVKGSTATHSQ